MAKGSGSEVEEVAGAPEPGAAAKPVPAVEPGAVAKPVSVAPAGVAQIAKPKPTDVFQNVHGTLLTLDNGRAFSRGSVMRLTPTEVERFRRIEAITKQRFIIPHPGPAHNA
jgi:hypothetical protein